MHKHLLISCGLLFSGAAFCQNDIKNYVEASTIKISTISPDSTDYSDLESIGNAIGDAKIVMLGEQDHGDAPTFSAKTRLIKYLHEKKGFNVLAFEADFFYLNYKWQFVQSGQVSVTNFVKSGISGIWSSCDACQDLFYNYLGQTLKTKTPLEISGFDEQLSSKAAYPVLDSIWQSNKLPITQTPAYKTDIFPLLNEWYKYSKDTATNAKIRDYLTEIKNQMLQKFSPDDFWIKVVENLIQENLQFNNYKKDYWKDMNVRDAQMALNLKWLNDVKYSNQKIIVWAHNYHIAKYGGHYPEGFMNNGKSMGTNFTSTEKELKQTYVLGFTSYEGTAGRLYFGTNYKLPHIPSNSFENWINKKYDFSFTDFKQFNTANSSDQKQFYMSGSIKGNAYHTNHQADWNKIFDGVFFIREMYPCKKVE